MDAAVGDVASDVTRSEVLKVEAEPITASVDERSECDKREETADMLAQQLERLVQSVSVVEELSRRARDVATNDLARCDDGRDRP